jgi:hypothetical protein
MGGFKPPFMPNFLGGTSGPVIASLTLDAVQVVSVL